ncbi:MAG: transglutaminase domain-containing protein [Lachnospiraceae bacterium]|nr:transglutaminase domain-containing protein [Lachnospiraceae bacterium]
MRLRTVFATVFMVACVLAGAWSADPAGRAAPSHAAPGADVPFSKRLKNREEIVMTIRQGLKDRVRAFTVSFSDTTDVLSVLGDEVAGWMEEALADTGAADEGDYLRYQYGGYTYNALYTQTDGRYDYTVRIEPVMYTDAAQEEAVDAEVERLMQTLPLTQGMSDEEKVRVIYDYLCANVTYDKVHRKKEHDHIDATAYAALIRHTASCQGYCTALYRLLETAGIESRIRTTSTQTETLHAFVEVMIDGTWLVLDPTYDAGQETYRYFLIPREERNH